MRYFIFYLVIQHYFSIFVAELAMLQTKLCRTKNEYVMYIHERDNWTHFRWDASQVSLLQEVVFRKQGMLYGRLGSLGFDSKLREVLPHVELLKSIRKLVLTTFFLSKGRSDCHHHNGHNCCDKSRFLHKEF